MGQADGCTTTKNACRLSVLSQENTRGATSMKRLDMHYWRAGYSESCTVSSVGGRRKRVKQLVPRRRPTQLNKGGKARPKGCDTSHWLATFVPVQGYTWSGPVRCFTEASSRLDCTLVARWDEEYQDPWLIVTDLLPTQADVAWYAMRAWIECGENRYQTRRLELASHQDGRSWTRRAALVGDGSGHPVGRERGWREGCLSTSQYAGSFT